MPRLPPEPPYSLCRKTNTNTHSPPVIRCTSPPYSKHSNRGVKHDLGVNNQLFRMRRFAKEYRLFTPVATVGLSPQKRKFPVSSLSVRSTKSRHKYFEDLRLWKVHKPDAWRVALHLIGD